MRKIILITLAVLAIATLAVAAWVLSRPVTAPAAEQASEPDIAPTAQGRLIIGDVQAPLTLLAYGDFQCPRCGRFFAEIEPRIRDEFVEQGLLKIEWRNFAVIGPESKEAAAAAHCSAAQNAFSDFYDTTFSYMHNNYWSQNRAGENVGALSRANLKTLAAQSSDLINLNEFNRCLDEGRFAQTVEDELASAQAAGFSLNSYVVGSETIQGVQPFAIFKTIIETQL